MSLGAGFQRGTFLREDRNKAPSKKRTLRPLDQGPTYTVGVATIPIISSNFSLCYRMKKQKYFNEFEAHPLTASQARRLSELSHSLSQSQQHINNDDNIEFILIKSGGKTESAYPSALQRRIEEIEDDINRLEGCVIEYEPEAKEQAIGNNNNMSKTENIRNNVDSTSGDSGAHLNALRQKHLRALEQFFPIHVVGAEQGISTFTIRGLYFTVIAPTSHTSTIDDADTNLMEQSNAAIGYALLYLSVKHLIDRSDDVPFDIYYEGSTSTINFNGHHIPCYYTNSPNDSINHALRLISRAVMIGHNRAINTT